MSNDGGIDTRFAGISLEQFAGVSAALADDIPLAAVLEQEQIEPSAWPAAQRGWRQAIATTMALQLSYMQKLRVAEDCLVRATTPVDSDPGAWVGLLGKLASADDSAAVLGGLGLTACDMNRLGRSWQRKAERDANIAKQLQELAPKAVAPDKVTVGPIELRRFPWSPAPRVPDAPSASDALAASDAERVANLPVGPAAPVKASFQLSAAQAPVAAPSPIPKLNPRMGSTSDIDDRKLREVLSRGSVPFAPSSGPVAPSPSSAPPRSSRRSGGTLADTSRDTGSPALPFEGDAELELMKLERYVELAAALRAAPHDADAIMASLGLTEPIQRQRVHQLWRRRFEANAELRQRFEKLVDAKRAGAK